MEETKLSNKEEKRMYYKSLFEEAENYFLGENGFQINEQEALKRYLACAEYYDEDPEFEENSFEMVGTIYDEFINDYEKAFAWYKKAYEVSDLDKVERLGEMYELGLGTPVDYAKAVECYRKDVFFIESGLAERVYTIYKDKKLNDPEEEEKARIDAAYSRREQHRKIKFYTPAAEAAAQPYEIFSKEMFIKYFNSDFHKDLRTFFNFSYDYGDHTYTFVREVEFNERDNYGRKIMRWKGCHRIYMFSVAVFYIHSMAQVIGHLYGYRKMEDFLRASGWPLIHCSAGGHMHPIQVIYDGDLYPSKNRVEEYIEILNTSKDFIKEYFSYFLQGKAPNLNPDAYARLCEVVNIENLLKDIDDISDNYVKWIKYPDTDYPFMLFDYPHE